MTRDRCWPGRGCRGRAGMARLHELVGQQLGEDAEDA